MPGRQRRNILAVLGDRKLSGTGELAVPVNDLDLVLLQQMRHAARQPPGNPARPFDDGRRVKRNVFRRQAIVLGVLHQMIDLGRPQQRLGRDAAPVETDAAQMLALDNRRLHPQLRRPDRRHIAARAPAHDNQIEFGISHIFGSAVPGSYSLAHPEERSKTASRRISIRLYAGPVSCPTLSFEAHPAVAPQDELQFQDFTSS